MATELGGDDDRILRCGGAGGDGEDGLFCEVGGMSFLQQRGFDCREASRLEGHGAKFTRRVGAELDVEAGRMIYTHDLPP